jgi:PilX N-terminal
MKLRAPPSSQRGAAALAVTLLLFFVLALVLAFANRHLVFEQRTATNQVRAAQAFEAAQAGVQWGLAMLNSHQRINEDCLPDNSNSASLWRERHLQFNTSTRLQHATAGHTAACVREGNEWRCHCPAQGLASLPLTQNDEPVPGFVVQLLETTTPGQVHLQSKGCHSAGPACWNMNGEAPAGEAQAHQQVHLALVGGPRTPPAAPLTARGHITGQALGAHHPDAASGGVALHAGGSVQITAPQLSSVAGGSTSHAVAAMDADLAGLNPDVLFTAVWGMGPQRWAAQTSVRPVLCSGGVSNDCSSALQQAIAQRGNRLLWVEGDVLLDAGSSTLPLGSPDQPVVLVVRGQLILRGAVQIVGAVYANELQWQQASSNAGLQGAAWSTGNVTTDGAPQFVWNAAVLSRLRWNTGSWAVLPGGWSDQTP